MVVRRCGGAGVRRCGGAAARQCGGVRWRGGAAMRCGRSCALVRRPQVAGCRLQAAGLRVERGHQSVLEQLARAPQHGLSAAVVAVDLARVRARARARARVRARARARMQMRMLGLGLE